MRKKKLKKVKVIKNRNMKGNIAIDPTDIKKDIKMF